MKNRKNKTLLKNKKILIEQQILWSILWNRMIVQDLKIRNFWDFWWIFKVKKSRLKMIRLWWMNSIKLIFLKMPIKKLNRTTNLISRSLCLCGISKKKCMKINNNINNNILRSSLRPQKKSMNLRRWMNSWLKMTLLNKLNS